ncbi:TetR/AcrR family transcriptional regulator [Ilumatobacter sp.]|uniref:TetR/AcrR family transcriptional regulator n=1 Tax=Ilumatobacter sp. TaxID=1967498 RepID=UPI003B516C64
MEGDVSGATELVDPGDAHDPGDGDAAHDEDELDPRVRRTHEAVHDAGRELLLEQGPEAITHAAMASAARLSRTTLYRYWPTRAELLLDICQASEPRRRVEPSGDLRRDVVDVATASSEVLVEPAKRKMLAQMLAQAQWDAEAREVLATLAGVGITDLHAILDRGVTDGELRPGIDPGTVAGRLLGPLLFAALVEHRALDVAAIERLVDDWLATVRA